MSRRIYVVRDIVVPANTPKRIPIEGDWVTVLSASGEFALGFDRTEPQPGIEAGLAIPAGLKGYTHVVIVNQGGSELTLRLVFNEDGIKDNRLVISGGLTVENGSTLATPTDVALVGAAAAVEVIATNTSRKFATITNLSANTDPIRIGGANTAADAGTELSPGQSAKITSKAALYAYSPTNQSVSVEEGT